MSLREAEVATPGSLEPGLYLGRFDADALRRELADCGLLPGLAAQGYPDVVIRTGLEAGEHRLRILPARGRVCLVDLRLAETTSVVEEPLMRQRGLELLSFLAVRWLALQNPKRRFTPGRPRLPGQRYPGLGLGRLLYDRLTAWAGAWGKDGLLNIPEYFHNAAFYSELFRFLSPRQQGRFEALRRDLAGLHVASASAAIEGGRVREAGSGEVVRWRPGEMAAPLAPELKAYLVSDDYHRAVARERDAFRFTLRRGRLG